MSNPIRALYDEIVAPPGEDELPYSFGPPMDTEIHAELVRQLVPTLREWLDRPDVYVAGDMAMYFSALQLKKNDFVGPDVFVVTDTVRRARKSWVMWQELRAPSIVIEITSPSTEHIDRGDKKDRIYAKALRVPEYYIFDPATGVLEGYTLDPVTSTYLPKQAAGTGEYRCSVLPVGLKVVEQDYFGDLVPWLRWTDAGGVLLPLPQEVAASAKAEAESAKAEAESAKAEAESAKARAEALAARLRALGIDPDA